MVYSLHEDAHKGHPTRNGVLFNSARTGFGGWPVDEVETVRSCQRGVSRVHHTPVRERTKAVGNG